MAITNKQAWAGTSVSTGNAVLTLGSVPVAGNLLVATCNLSDLINTISFSDNIGDGVGWTVSLGPVRQANLAQGSYIAWKPVGTPSGGGKAITATPSLSGLIVDLYAAEYQAGSVTWGLDGTPTSATGTATASLPDPGGIVTTSSGPLIIGVVSTFPSVPVAVTNWTIRVTGASNNNDATEDRIAVASGTYDPSWTGTGVAESWIAMGIAFKATAAASFNPGWASGATKTIGGVF